MGEGEEVFPGFLQDLERGEPKARYDSTGTIDIDSLPLPRFDVVPDILWYDKVPLFATRGCPRQCRFCCLGQVYGPRCRKKSPRRVAREVQLARSVRQDPFITFADENMLVDRSWARQLAVELEPLNVKWEAYCDVSVGEDPELLGMLSRAGCVELLIGFETTNRRSLKNADPWKARQIENYGKYIRRIQQAGIGVLGCFVVGFDDDDPGTFHRLKEFLSENPLFELDMASLTPMPGTPLFDDLSRDGRIFDRRWHRYTWYHVNFQPMHMTPAADNRWNPGGFRFLQLAGAKSLPAGAVRSHRVPASRRNRPQHSGDRDKSQKTKKQVWCLLFLLIFYPCAYTCLAGFPAP